MKLVHYLNNGEIKAGIVKDGFVYDIQNATKKIDLPIQATRVTIDNLLSDDCLHSLQQAEERITNDAPRVSLDGVKLRSPLLYPEKILLLARNYLSHSMEKGLKPPAEPYLFTKFRNALIGPGDPILLPKITKKVDWEVELAVIIGKPGKYIAREHAMSYVAGYAVANDISFRDLQYSTQLPDGKTNLGMNWVKGKGLDSSFPLGPWLVTKDEIPDPHKLQMSLSVNGKKNQNSNTSDMVFKIDQLIEYASAGITLLPGDVISTGTPGGVAAATGEPFLRDGDVVEATIERIGTLRNPVKAE